MLQGFQHCGNILSMLVYNVIMNVTYREYEDNDFGELRDMIFCLYAEDPEGQPIDDAKIAKTINESETHPDKLRIVMIRADEAVVGYGILVFCWSNEYGGDILCIDELYIKKEYRGNRLASGFIGYLMNTYKNAAAMAVETTPSNEAALELYKRFGFEASRNNHLVLPLP